MSEPTAEERRAALIERVARAQYAGIQGGAPGPSVAWEQQFEQLRVKRLRGAERVLDLLESGDAGVYLVAGADLQDAVGIVLQTKRRAEAERDEARAELAALRDQTSEAHAVLSSGYHESSRWENPLPVPRWVTDLALALDVDLAVDDPPCDCAQCATADDRRARDRQAGPA